MTKDYPHRPFGQIIPKHASNISGAASIGFMITRAPWQAPVNKYYVIRKLVVSQMSSVNSGLPLSLAIWDADLSNTTPVARGSSASPLISIPLSFGISGGTVAGTFAQPSNLVMIGQDQMPPEFFQAGITCVPLQGGAAVSISGSTISMELEVV